MNIQELIQYIQLNIKANGIKSITGTVLQKILVEICENITLSEVSKPLKISDELPIEDGIYLALESGLYSNGIDVDLSEGITYLVLNEEVWSKTVYPVNLVPDGVVEEGNTEAVSGSEVFSSLVINNINKGKSYPFLNQSENLNAGTVRMNEVLLDCVIEELTSSALYEWTLTLIAKNATLGNWGNALHFRRYNKATGAQVDTYQFKSDNSALDAETLKNINKLSAGGLQTITLTVPAWSKTFNLLIDTDAINDGEVINASYTDLDNKMIFDKSCYKLVSGGQLATKNEMQIVQNWQTNANTINTNLDKDFPVIYDASVSPTSSLITVLNNVLMDCVVETSDDLDLYTYELAYLNINRVQNTGRFDNTIQLIRRLRSNPESFRLVEVNNLVGFYEGYVFNYVWEIGEAKVTFTFNGATTYTGARTFSNTAGAEMWGKQWIDKSRYFKVNPQLDLTSVMTKNSWVKVVGENLYIGSKYNATQDILIHFKKCMFNELMTFYNVGLASNTDFNPRNNPDRTTTTNLNTSTSDNIGPVQIDTTLWSGGNHSYLSDGITKTAETLSFKFYADGKELKDGDLVPADSVEIKVINRLFNPLLPDVNGDLNTELCTEEVIYKVEKGSIAVSLVHRYSSNANVTTYYGMQSMFIGETELMTPLGSHIDWGDASVAVSGFNKVAYPDFNRFLEKSANGYQSTYLLPIDNGTHDLVNTGASIFIRSGSKTYHRITGALSTDNTTVVSWSGLYTWFEPIVDDSDMIIYESNMNGIDILFIDVKTAINKTINLPVKYILKEFDVNYKSDTLTIDDNITVKGFNISSTGSGSCILYF